MTCDDKENIFAQRYLRMNPVMIQPHGSREAGITMAFTILFKHVYSFTFCYYEQRGQMTEASKQTL